MNLFFNFISKNDELKIFNTQKEKSYMMHKYGFSKSDFQKDEYGVIRIPFSKARSYMKDRSP